MRISASTGPADSSRPISTKPPASTSPSTPAESRLRLPSRGRLCLYPSPTHALRPIVRATTRKYNSKLRLGRGFTLTELRQAGLSSRFARTIGIAVDHRRKNRTQEALETNVDRLKEFKAKIVL